MWVGHRGTHTGLLDIQKIIDTVTEEKAGPPRGVLNQARPLPNGWITSKQSAFSFPFSILISVFQASGLGIFSSAIAPNSACLGPSIWGGLGRAGIL